MPAVIERKPFGITPEGCAVSEFTFTNACGATLAAIDYGGIVTSIRVPDRTGQLREVVLGFESFEGYLGAHPYFGAVVGRVAGRIPGARFRLGDAEFRLAANDGENHLHGGPRGFDKRMWEAEEIVRDGGRALRLRYGSPDGEEGYPGRVEAELVVAWGDNCSFEIASSVRADRATPVNLTHHSYFRLGGSNVLDHELRIAADAFFPADETLRAARSPSPTGGTGADFRQWRRIGDALEGLHARHGDLYLLRPGDGVREAARVRERGSGIELTVFTDEPCLQFYTGAMLGDYEGLREGRGAGPFGALCLECQGNPAAIGTGLPFDPVLPAGAERRRVTRYVFSTGASAS